MDGAEIATITIKW